MLPTAACTSLNNLLSGRRVLPGGGRAGEPSRRSGWRGGTNRPAPAVATTGERPRPATAPVRVCRCRSAAFAITSAPVDDGDGRSRREGAGNDAGPETRGAMPPHAPDRVSARLPAVGQPAGLTTLTGSAHLDRVTSTVPPSFSTTARTRFGPSPVEAASEGRVEAEAPSARAEG